MFVGLVGEKDFLMFIIYISSNLTICIFQISCFFIFHTVLVSERDPNRCNILTKPLCRLFTKHHCSQNRCITQHNLHAVWAQKGFFLHLMSVFVSQLNTCPQFGSDAREVLLQNQLFLLHPSAQRNWPFGFSV